MQADSLNETLCFVCVCVVWCVCVCAVCVVCVCVVCVCGVCVCVVYVCVCVALGIQHAMRMRRIVICGLPGSTKILRIIS